MGPRADTFGREPVLLLADGAIAAGMFAATAARSFERLIAARAVKGLGIGGILPALASITTEFSSARHRDTTVGLVQAVWPLGAIVTGAVAGVVLSSGSWRGLFALVGTLITFYTWPARFRHSRSRPACRSRWPLTRVPRSIWARCSAVRPSGRSRCASASAISSPLVRRRRRAGGRVRPRGARDRTDARAHPRDRRDGAGRIQRLLPDDGARVSGGTARIRHRLRGGDRARRRGCWAIRGWLVSCRERPDVHAVPRFLAAPRGVRTRGAFAAQVRRVERVVPIPLRSRFEKEYRVSKQKFAIRTF